MPARALRHLWGAIRLVHPFPVSTVVATSVVFGAVASRGNVDAWFLSRLGASVLFSQVAVGAYNDYVDRERDAVSQANKPIPSGQSSPRVAIGMTIGSVVLMVPAALSLGTISLVLVVGGTAAGLAYDQWLQRTPWSVTCYVAGFLLLVTWIWVITGRFTLALLLLYPVGALLVTVAHLAQSLPDVEGDEAVGASGLAVALGVSRSIAVTVCGALLMAAGAFAVALLTRAWALSALPLLAAVLVVAAAARLRDGHQDRDSRVFAFRLITPAIAAVALSAAASMVHAGWL